MPLPRSGCTHKHSSEKHRGMQFGPAWEKGVEVSVWRGKGGWRGGERQEGFLAA